MSGTEHNLTFFSVFQKRCPEYCLENIMKIKHDFPQNVIKRFFNICNEISENFSIVLSDQCDNYFYKT